MWIPEDVDPQVSFLVPVTAPTALPGDAPTICVPINAEWIPFVIGALFQLTLPTTWDGMTVSVPEMQARATDLISQFINALACMQYALRYVPECQLQFSTDGGVTWTQVPGWDPYFAECVRSIVGPVTNRLIMAPGITYPPVPVQTPDGADWVYSP